MHLQTINSFNFSQQSYIWSYRALLIRLASNQTTNNKSRPIHIEISDSFPTIKKIFIKEKNALPISLSLSCTYSLSKKIYKLSFTLHHVRIQDAISDAIESSIQQQPHVGNNKQFLTKSWSIHNPLWSIQTEVKLISFKKKDRIIIFYPL